MSHIELIGNLKHWVAEEIREYSRSQVELWRQVPWLALQASGRSHVIGNYNYAYHGSWILRTREVRLKDLPFVDCATGEILCNHDTVVGPEIDDGIIEISRMPSLIDAAAIVEQLKAEASAPQPDWVSENEAAKREAWRKDLAQRLNLSPYVPKLAVPA